MSRQQQETQGVVLTGYHSNAELLPKTGACAPAQEHEHTSLRWEIYVLLLFTSTVKTEDSSDRRDVSIRKEQRSQLAFSTLNSIFLFRKV